MQNDTNSDGHINSLVKEHLSATPYVVVVFLLALLVPIVVISNGVVIATTFLLPTLHKPTDHIMAALASLDFLIGLITIPIFISKNIPETWHIFREYKVTCLLSWIVHDFTEYGSLAFLFFLCLERFLCINWPYFYRDQITGRRIHYVIFFIYTNELCQTLVIYLIYYEFNESEPHLDERCSYYNTPVVVYRYVLPGKIAFAVTGSVLMTIRVGYVTVSHLFRIRKETMQYGETYSTAPRRHSKIVLILMLMFVPMWAPSVVVNMVHKKYYYTNPRYADYFDLGTMMLRMANSGMNAFAYAFTKKTYRSAYFHVLTTPPWRWSDIVFAVRRAVACSVVGIPQERRLGVMDQRLDGQACKRGNVNTEETSVTHEVSQPASSNTVTSSANLTKTVSYFTSRMPTGK